MRLYLFDNDIKSYCTAGTVHSHTIHRIAAVIEVYVCGVWCVCVYLVSYITITMDVSLLIYLCLTYNLYIPHTCTHTGIIVHGQLY